MTIIPKYTIEDRIFACLMHFCHGWSCMQDPRMALDACMYMSGKLRRSLARHGIDSSIATCNIQEHHWVIVGDYQIDITARQLVPDCQWPLVWHNGEPHPFAGIEVPIENGETKEDAIIDWYMSQQPILTAEESNQEIEKLNKCADFVLNSGITPNLDSIY